MKYRVVIRNSTVYPYQVERGRDEEIQVEVFKWFRRKLHIEITTEWFGAGIFSTIEEAQKFIQEDIERVRTLGKEIIPGNVVFEYDESDMVVERLKGLR